MLVLTRKIGERLMIGNDIIITIVDIRDGKCRIGIDAPATIPIAREELLQKSSKCDRCGAWITTKNHGQTTATTTLCETCLKGK
jgi:carbon storage regulator